LNSTKHGRLRITTKMLSATLNANILLFVVVYLANTAIETITWYNTNTVAVRPKSHRAAHDQRISFYGTPFFLTIFEAMKRIKAAIGGRIRRITL
jgi:hypothetical protein